VSEMEERRRGKSVVDVMPRQTNLDGVVGRRK
jgi:hypothetical protein